MRREVVHIGARIEREPRTGPLQAVGQLDILAAPKARVEAADSLEHRARRRGAAVLARHDSDRVREDLSS